MLTLVRIILALIVAFGSTRGLVWFESEEGTGASSSANTSAERERDGLIDGDEEAEIEDVPFTGEGEDPTPMPTQIADGTAGSGVVGDAVSDDSEFHPGGKDPVSSAPTTYPQATATATTPAVGQRPDGVCYDDAVLRWLPELRAAARQSDVSVTLLAGVVRVESDGDPGLIGFDDRHGLAGVGGRVLRAAGLSESEWYDPESNLVMAAKELSRIRSEGKAWRQVVRKYVGNDCDALDQCTALRMFAILAWNDAYASMLRSPETSRLETLSSTWQLPSSSPHRDTSPRQLVLPAGVAWPTPTATEFPTETPTLQPTQTETVPDDASPTAGPTNAASPESESVVEGTPGSDASTVTTTPSVVPEAEGSPHAVDEVARGVDGDGQSESVKL